MLNYILTGTYHHYIKESNMINIKDIEAAYERIEKYVWRTRLEKSLYLSDKDTEAYMKLECEQPIVKNFKLREFSEN